MKRLIALPFSALMVVSVQVSALCLNISESFTGIIGPGGDSVAHGPFTISGANGCSGANINAMVSAGGAGRSPQIYIDQEVGSSWKTVAGNAISANTSWLGTLGTYRVRLHNPDGESKSYSGTVRYGR
ncbi:hypothetical protein GIW79_12785 [Pseudomonas sp. PA-7-1E]|uniref:hypothetical protein n=1 Tax=unclassified Pseudomonas TaxID=196821 RepID=UPI001F39B519|nr:MULTISPECIES: hypothetical protein [unclassified Pseudomonas]MCF5041334.1 hypothetical protein [Pseudomonas sp. PA-7-1E]MCF5129005.1 hypothetical protein [Pseudomonas sp. PA-6-4F]